MSCIFTGWGRMGPDEDAPVDMFGQPWSLRKTNLPPVDDVTCSVIYLVGAEFITQSTMQCAGGDGHTSCKGESGGPLVCEKDGVVPGWDSDLSPCDASIPAVHTRVSSWVCGLV